MHCYLLQPGQYPKQNWRRQSVVIKDAEGKTIKEWKCEDVLGANGGTAIPVVDLIALQKKEAQQVNVRT